MDNLIVWPLEELDRPWATSVLARAWHSARVVTRGRVHQADSLPGLVAIAGGQRVGLLTYRREGDEIEVVTLNSLWPRRGVGTALLAAIEEIARFSGCRRLWLVTTNDNLVALRFYQKRGWSLVAVHREAMHEARRLKPEIPLLGENGIPLRDEIELEYIVEEKSHGVS